MALGSDDEKKKILDVLFTVLYETVKLLNPVCPFISEQIYQNFVEKEFVNEESINLEFWSKFDEKFIDAEFEKEFKIGLSIIEAGLHARDIIKSGARWPHKVLSIDTDKKEVVNKFKKIIKTQLNVKEIDFKKPDINLTVKPDYRKFGVKYGAQTGDYLTAIKGKEDEIANAFEQGIVYSSTVYDKPIELGKELFNITETCKTHAVAGSSIGNVYLEKEIPENLMNEGFAREITRRVQSLRKKAEMNKSDRIELFLQLPDDLSIKEFEDNLKIKVGAGSISHTGTTSCEFKSDEKIKGKQISLGFNRKIDNWKVELEK